MKRTKKTYPNNTKHKKIIIFAVLFVFLAIGVLFYLHSTGKIGLFNRSATETATPARTTSDVPSAQPDYTAEPNDEDNKEPGNSVSEDQGSAIVNDNLGNNVIQGSDPILSEDSNITLYSPQKNTSVKNGVEITGLSKLTNVEYRIIDSTSGVIASGSLKVVNGQFSGKLTANTSAKEGRIDVFATKADGTEYANIEVPVRFQ